MTTKAPVRGTYTGDDLWDRYFFVRVNSMASANPLRMEKYGMRVTGVEEWDRDIDKQENTCQWNINMMFEHWRRGNYVRVVNYADTVIIYDIIQQHLYAWAQHLKSGINVGDAPLKDLIELDQFTKVVYDKARNMFTPEERETAIASNFTNISKINFSNILGRVRAVSTITADGIEVTEIQKDEPKVEVDRHSYQNAFEKAAKEIGIWRAKL